MPEMNFPTTSEEIHWILREPSTGRENLDIEWRFTVGDVVKLRLTNDRDAFHAMQHPFHVHGQRFLVLSRNGVPNENLVWKDTMLLAAGETSDLLLEISNPGRWMAHCHIAEHLETGMKLVFTVEGSQ
jgi:FtsP/CotA-like multicopper oxidase with cupredoxin domain